MEKFMYIIVQKTIDLMKNIYSLKEINKVVLSLENEKQIFNSEKNLYIPNFYKDIYEESISLLVELSILLRRECEQLQKAGISVNSSVKYCNIGKFANTNQSISFYDMLSKIVHASRVAFTMKEPNGKIGLGFTISLNSFFTGYATIRVTDKQGFASLVEIDLKKFCSNAFQIGAETQFLI